MLVSDSKRPWQGAETRLGIRIFGRDTVGKQQPEAGIGWALHRLRPSILAQGEAAIPMPNDPDTADLTGAEYKTLREECGLSVSEAADFHDVREGTVKKWEKTAPPPGAAFELLSLRRQIDAAARKALEVYLNALSNNSEIEGVDLYRYEAWAYAESVPASEGLPHGAHNRIIAKTADLLADNGISLKIEYWSPESAKGLISDPELPDFISRPRDD